MCSQLGYNRFMKLRSYLDHNGLSYGEFARSIGACNARTVQRYVTGERSPDRKRMSAIMRETKGKVGPADFFTPEQTSS